MEFSIFLKNLTIDEIKNYSGHADKFLLEYKKHCKDERDFIQLYELKNILAVADIFDLIYNAYLNCTSTNLNPLYDEIELLSNLLEENDISCYTYAYYFYVYLMHLCDYDLNLMSDSKCFTYTEMPEKLEWIDPRKFDYLNVSKTTFGINTAAIPKYNDFECVNNKLISVKGSKHYVVIPDTVSVISSTAFQNNRKVKMVIIPDSVTEIEEGAFSGCKGLNLVHLSDKITKIPDGCFKNCTNLKYIIGNHITEVGDSAFELCVLLKEINLDALTYVGDRSFYGCVSLDNFDFISNLSYIGDFAFSNCSVESLFLNCYEYLGTNAFNNCSSLDDIIINTPIEKIGKTPFIDCSSIRKLDIRTDISYRIIDLFTDLDEDNSIELNNFEQLHLSSLSPSACCNLSMVKNIYVSKEVDVIPDNAFKNCFNLTSIIFENSHIKSIGESAFENCSSLMNVDINYVGTKIGNYAFYHCSSINDFNFLKDVEEFGEYCLAHTNLVDFDFLNRKYKYIGSFAFSNSYYPNNVNINLNNVTLCDNSLHGFTDINYFEIKNCAINQEEFYKIFEETKESFISNVKILNFVTDFNAKPYLFEGSGSTFIECNTENGEISEGLFYECSSLKSVRINGTVEKFGISSFEGCSELEYIDVTTGDNIKVYDNAFTNCQNYEYPFLDKTTVIGDYAFYGSNLSKLELNNNVLYIGNSAFGNCPISSKIILPFIGNEVDSTEPLGVIFAHDRIDNSEELVFNNKKYYIPSMIKEVVVTSKNINNTAFENCYFLEKIELPFVEKMLSPSFLNCSSLNELIIGEHLEELNNINLTGVNPDVKIDVRNTNKFLVENNCLYSQDKTVLYYSNGEEVPNNVSIFKSYSMLNVRGDISLENIKLIESNSFDLSETEKIYIKNSEVIEENAFFNSERLIEIEMDLNTKVYENIFNASTDELKIEKIVLSDTKVNNIKNIFSNINKLTINDLYLNEFNLNEKSFNDLSINKLHISNCTGSTTLDNNVSNVIMDNSLPLNAMLKGENKFETIHIAKDLITENDISGINCAYVCLSNVEEIRANSFNNVKIKQLDIEGVNHIERDTFYNSSIQNINITDSPYACIENCIFKDSRLYYYQPNNENATIPQEIKTVYRNSINLVNAKSLEIPNDIEMEERSIFNASNIERLKCGYINVTKLVDLFDNCSNIKEIHFTSDVVTKEYLSSLESVETIYLDETISRIEHFAFSNNVNLKSVINIDKARYYGDLIFYNCSNLKTIKLNPNADIIGLGIVEECSSLESIEMPLLDYYEPLELCLKDVLGDNISNVDIMISQGDISSKMFENVTNKIVIMKSPNVINDYAFMNVNNLTIDLTNTKYIGSNAFKNSTLPSQINLKSCEYIGHNAFSNCDNLNFITLNESINQIESDAFNGLNLTGLTINNNQKYRVEQDCLFEQDNLIYYVSNSKRRDINITFDIDTIKEHTFNSCNQLSSIKFKNVKTIEENVFDSCSQLETLCLGQNEIDVRGNIFYNCPKLKYLELYKIKQGLNNCLSDYFKLDNDNDIIPVTHLTINYEELDSSELKCNNILTSIMMNDNIKEIPNGYFQDCASLTTITFPSKCEIIGDNAFNGCKKLTKLDLNKSAVEEIGNMAFANTNIQQMNFSSKVKKIGQDVFENTPISIVQFNNDLISFSCEQYGIGDSITEVYFHKTAFAENSFANSINLKKVAVEIYTKQEIPYGCFSECVQLKEVSIPKTYNLIRENAFKNCNGLISLYIPEGVKVEDNAYYGCNSVNSLIYESNDLNFSLSRLGFNKDDSKLNKIELNNVELSKGAFSNFRFLNNIDIKNPILEIPKECFKDCINLNSINIKGFKVIGESAFENCNYLDHIDLRNCEEIYENAFNKCYSLKEITVPHTIKKLGNAFKNCQKLSKITFNNEISNFKLANYGFDYDSKLNNVTLSRCTLSDGAFRGYYNIQGVQFRKALEIIPNNCFEGCRSINFQDDFFSEVREIGSESFKDCYSIINLNLYNIEKIAEYAFANCKNLESISFGKKLKIIPSGLLSGCEKLENVRLSESIEKIGKYAFSNTMVKQIDVYESMKFVDSMIFKGNSTSVKVVLPYKKFDTTTWAPDWNQGFNEKHSLLRFLNAGVTLKARR